MSEAWEPQHNDTPGGKSSGAVLEGLPGSSQQKLLFVLCLSRCLSSGLQTQNDILQGYQQELLEPGR